MGSAGKTNQNLLRIEFTLDHHLKLPTPCPSLAGQGYTCQNLSKPALPINIISVLKSTSLAFGALRYYVGSHVLNKQMSRHHLFTLCKEFYVPPTAAKKQKTLMRFSGPLVHEEALLTSRAAICSLTMRSSRK